MDQNAYAAHHFSHYAHPYAEPVDAQYVAQAPYFAPSAYPLCDPYALADQPPPQVEQQQYSYVDQPAVQVAPAYEDFAYQFPAAYELPPYDPPPPPPPSESYIHAPIPISAYSTLLPHVTQHFPAAATQAAPAAGYSMLPRSVTHTPAPVLIKTSPSPDVPMPSASTPRAGDELLNPLEIYDSPQVTFPTPSELLEELTQRDRAAGIAPHPDLRMSVGPERSTPPPEPRKPSRRSKKQRPKFPAALRPPEPGRPDNLRKSYFRSVAENVGFQSTDPDTITSHDKKRYYLESLEQYVLWLHDRVALAGHTPSNVERIDSHGGLSIPSMRIMLVQMQDEARNLNNKLIVKENQYLESVEVPSGSSAAPESLTPPPPPYGYDRVRRHSIASGLIQMCPSSHVQSDAGQSAAAWT